MSELVILSNGTKEWRDKEGKFHRKDGPAVIFSQAKYWCRHGKLHREDGPAVVYSNGYKKYYLNNKGLTKEEWFERLPKEQKIKMAFKLDQL